MASCLQADGCLVSLDRAAQQRGDQIVHQDRHVEDVTPHYLRGHVWDFARLSRLSGQELDASALFQFAQPALVFGHRDGRLVDVRAATTQDRKPRQHGFE